MKIFSRFYEIQGFWKISLIQINLKNIDFFSENKIVICLLLIQNTKLICEKELNGN